MALAGGTRLGPYEIVSFIGAGSMARFIVPGTRAWSVMSQ